MSAMPPPTAKPRSTGTPRRTSATPRSTPPESESTTSGPMRLMVAATSERRTTRMPQSMTPNAMRPKYPTQAAWRAPMLAP